MRLSSFRFFLPSQSVAIQHGSGRPDEAPLSRNPAQTTTVCKTIRIGLMRMWLRTNVENSIQSLTTTKFGRNCLSQDPAGRNDSCRVPARQGRSERTLHFSSARLYERPSRRRAPGHAGRFGYRSGKTLRRRVNVAEEFQFRRLPRPCSQVFRNCHGSGVSDLREGADPAG